MVNIDVERSRVETHQPSENQCLGETKDCLVTSSRSSPPSDHRFVSYNMLKDKVQVKSQRNFSAREKFREEAARLVGYDPEQYSRPFKGKSRDLKAVIKAVKFKQIVLKHSSRKRSLLKEAILANTMRRAEEDLLIRRRHRQLRRAQAIAEEKAKDADTCGDNSSVDFMDDDALRSLEEFMQSLSSVTRS